MLGWTNIGCDGVSQVVEVISRMACFCSIFMLTEYELPHDVLQ